MNPIRKSLLLPMFVIICLCNPLAGCVHTKVVETRSGGEKYDTELDPLQAVGTTKSSKGCRVAVLPFMNTAKIVSTMNVNVALANQQMERAISSVEIPDECMIVPPSSAQKSLSKSNLTSSYSQMLSDYEATGLVDVEVVKKMGVSIGADTIVHGSLMNYDVDSTSNLFRSATVRFMAFDARSGELDWTIQVTGRQSFVDTRRTERAVVEVEEDASGVKAYTTLALASCLLGVTSFVCGKVLDNSAMQVVGGLMVLPLVGVPFVATMGPTETSVSGNFDPPDSPRTIDEGLGDLVAKVIGKIFEENIQLNK